MKKPDGIGPYNAACMARSARTIAIGLLTLATALAATAQEFPYEDGDLVVVRGLVTDSAGAPIPDLDIIVEAARERFSVRHFGKNKKDIVQGTTTSDINGEFGVEWNWSPRYNTFEIVVAVRAVDPDGSGRLEVLDRIDIADRVSEGSPVSVPVTLTTESSELVRSLREFEATFEGADQRRIYAEHGRPARVDVVETGAGTGVAWWFFEQGKVYRFVEGTLTEIDEFEPITPILPTEADS